MMSYTHILLGVSAYTLIHQDLSAAGLAAVAIGSILPDCDHPNALINRVIFPLRIIPKLTVHRGFTHSMTAIALIYLVLLTPYSWLYPLALGYALHIGADMLTVSGVRLFAPYHDMRVSLARIRTGKRIERVIAQVCSLYLCWFIVASFGYWYEIQGFIMAAYKALRY